MKRQYYIDNLRWLCIITLIPFHTAMAWNTWEGNYIWIRGSKILSSTVIMVCPFYMPLLFVLAGMSMNFALRKRSYSKFILERIKKLLIPLLSGILTVVAGMTYYSDRFHNGYTGSFLQHYKFFLGNIGDFTGYDGKFTPAHLWFMLFLFITSLILLLVVAFQRRFLPKITFINMRMWQVFLLVIVPIVFYKILDFGGKSIGESFAFVALGYYVFSEEEIMEKLKKWSCLFLGITFISSCIYTIIFVWMCQYDAFICVILHQISKWCGVLGLLGFGKKHLEINNKWTNYMTTRSFSIYIFHFIWIIIIQYHIHMYVSNIAITYIITVVVAFILTICTVEIVRRIPGVRFLYGLKK